MRIKQEQIDILSTIMVERLGKNADNVSLVSTFRSDKNPYLAKRIKDPDTLYKDLSGATAYYVVKSHKGELLLYFSLKCGELFVSLDIQKMDLAIKTCNALNMLDKEPDSQEYTQAQTFIRQNIQEIKNYWPDIDALLDDISTLKYKKEAYILELQKEVNENMQRVLRTFPAIEVVEFCANDNARDAWNDLGLPQNRKMGECVFWSFIVPIIQLVQKRVGCQYVYLFAADSSEERILENYYKNVLKFEQPKTLGANKPQYDFQCTFLCQEINKLMREKDYFFENFNPDEEGQDIV